MSQVTDGGGRRLSPAELAGIGDIAAMCGVKRATVDMWRTRGRLPEPWAVVSSTPLWERQVVVEWARASGRMEAVCPAPLDTEPGDLSNWTHDDDL